MNPYRRLVAAVAHAAMGLVAVGLAGCDLDPMRQPSAVDHARNALYQNNHRWARHYFRIHLETAPTDAQAHAALARSWYRGADAVLSQASEHYQQSLRLDPHQDVLRSEWLDVLMLLHEPELAEAARFNFSASELGRLLEARALLSQGSALSPELESVVLRSKLPDAPSIRALHAWVREDWVALIDACQEWMASGQVDLKAFHWLATAFRSLGQHERAESAYRTHSLLQEWLTQSDPESRLRLDAEATDQWPALENLESIQVGRAIAHVQLGQMAQAEQVINNWADPDRTMKVNAWLPLEHALVRTGRRELAEHLLDLLSVGRDATPELAYRKVRLRSVEGQEAWLRRILSKEASKPDARWMADLAARLYPTEPEAALVWMERALDWSPWRTDWRIQAADWCLSAGDFDKALALVRDGQPDDRQLQRYRTMMGLF